MSLRDKNLLPNEYYHIYNRGNGKNDIFLDSEDYERFTKILYIYNSENNFKFRDLITNQKIDAFDFERGNTLLNISAWVLMPNHFHLLVNSHRSDLWEENYNAITEYMRKVSTSYAMYFNKKYKRSGSLFEGKFKSKHIGEENYFNYIFAYIHLNPIKLIQSNWKEGINNKEEVLKYLQDFSHSSFQECLRINRKEGKIININSWPENFSISHPSEIFEWIENHRSDL